MKKVRKSKKNHTKSTKALRKFKKSLKELERDLKRVRFELSWYKDQNIYIHSLLDKRIDCLEEGSIPY